MIVRFYKTTQPLAVALLAPIAIVMWLISWKLQFKVVEPNGMPMYDGVIYVMRSLPSFMYAVIGFVLLASQALHLNYVLNKHEVLYKASWLPALIYLFTAAILPPFLWFHPLLFVNSILIFALDKIFSLYKNPDPLSLDFDSCFLLALASLFYLPAVVLFFIYVAGIIILRPFSWRDWVVGVVGFVLPFFFAFLYYFLRNEIIDFYDRVFITGITKKIAIKHIYINQYTYSLVLMGILFILSIIKLQSNYYKNVTKSRLIQQVILLVVVCGFFSVLVSREEQLYRFSILAIPLTVYLAYYFLSGKKQWIIELVFLLFAGGWVYNYFFAS